MKDCDSPSTIDDQPQRPVSSSPDAHCPSNGEIRLSNGSTYRRRSSSGGGLRFSDVNGSYCQAACNGHLTAPRVDQSPAPSVSPPAEPGFAAAEHVGGGGGWTVPTRVQILRDVANLCTFTGAILATLAMACMWKGR